MTLEQIKEKVEKHFREEEVVLSEEEHYGVPSLTIVAGYNLKVLQFLYDDAELGFTFLTDICGVHYPEHKGMEIAVVYHLHNLQLNQRLQLKLFVPANDSKVFTATRLFESANWMERETYDFFGIHFVGHPNLKRVLNVDEMDYFPMRKEYILEDQTRLDKDDEMFGRQSISASTH